MGTGNPTPQDACRILLVEDNELVARSVVRMLREQPYVATVASSAAAARSELQGGSVDVVLVDRGLPDADGVHLALEIRESHGLPVAVVSGGERPIGDLPWLSKPFRVGDLLELLGALLT